MTHTQRLERNLVLLCVHYGLAMCLFPVAIFSVFLREQIGLSVATIMWTQAVFAVVVALLEFPSGYLADRLGYRRTLVVGSTFIALAWVGYTFVDSLFTVILGECLLGVGFAVISGADLALLSETLSKLGREREMTRWLARRQLAGQLAGAVSAVGAGLLHAYWPRLPFLIEVLVFFAVTAVGLRLFDVSAAGPRVTDHVEKVKEIVLTATREQPELRRVIVALLLLSLATYVPIWFVPLYAVDAGLPVTWLGPFWAVSSVVTGVGASLVERLRAHFGMESLLWVVVGLIGLGYVGLGLSHSLGGVAFYFCLPLARGLHAPLLMAEEQRLIPSGDRASFVSFRSLLFRGAFFVVGPLVGLAVDLWGDHLTLVGCGVVLALACGLAVFCLRRNLSPQRAAIVPSG